jgi:hypothetical protein
LLKAASLNVDSQRYCGSGNEKTWIHNGFRSSKNFAKIVSVQLEEVAAASI